MPSISSNDKILITGANGYVALWIIKTSLEKGYSVRAAVRAESKASHLKALFKDYGSKLELAIVPDMTKDGAWDEAPNPEPETFFEPAIKGVVGLLESASKIHEIKRVVVTSSLAAVASDTKTPRVYTEEDWNDAAVKKVEEKGAEAGVGEIYSVQAVWDFYKKNKGQISWDLTTIVPPLVLGPPLDIHIRALETEKAGGERIFSLEGPYIWQELLEIASGLNLPNRKLPEGFSDIDKVTKVTGSKEKGIQIFGPTLKYRSKEETIKDTLDHFAKHGF
ncbi:D-lactaldehyde dehydrogenase [Coprinopsis sp. MPI-PUGE-AT-0042]|nr:D-lactaldehyde dehydrogenase [Coprinopsis sp. MPI-PUGE-AT-0042]